MKYIFYILLCLSLGFSACEDAIEIVPENSVTFDNALQTEKDLEAAVNSVQYYIREYLGNGAMYPKLRGYLSDLAFFQETSLDRYRRLEDDTYIELPLYNSYRVIAMSNMVLRAIEDIDLPEERYKLYKGTALFSKAYLYLLLSQKYGDCIIVENDIILEPVAPSPMVDVNAYAIDLAEQAVTLLPEYSKWRTKDGSSASRKDVACKGTAKALLAELCLWQAGCKWFFKAEDQNKVNQEELWAKAEKACTEIISSSEYALVGSADEICESMFKSISSEAIYQIPIRGYTSEAGFRTMSAFFTYSWPVRTDEQPANIMSKLFRLSSDFVKGMYDTEDERRNAFFYHLDNPTPEMVPFSSIAFPYKHRDAVINLTPGPLYGSFEGLHCDYIIYRLSQIYLFRAEARVRLNKDDLAIEDINEIRRRSNAPLYESSEFEGDVQMAVFKEADREFILEDERYPRIIRQGESYVREFLLGNFKTASISDFTDGAFFAPYDDGPFANNDLMRQNVYWSKRK